MLKKINYLKRTKKNVLKTFHQKKINNFNFFLRLKFFIYYFKYLIYQIIKFHCSFFIFYNIFVTQNFLTFVLLNF